MTRAFRNSLLKRLTATALLAVTLLAYTPAAISYADVIDGDIPVKSVITLADIFQDNDAGDDMSADEYRTFFHDMLDTKDVMIEEFERNKNNLKMVAKKLKAFEDSTLAALSDFETTRIAHVERIKYYELIRDGLLKNPNAKTDQDGSITYTASLSGSEDYTQLRTYPNGTWSITEQKEGKLYDLAYVETMGFATVKLNNDYSDDIMLSGNATDVYKGQMSDFHTKQGTGTMYSYDGSIDSGKWNEDMRDSYHYVYNVEEAFKAVNQFKNGIKHGMSSYQAFEEDHVYTRVFLNDKISGYSYSEFVYDGYNAEVMYYYEDEERLPLAYITYPDKGLSRVVIGEDEDQVEIYDSQRYDRLFIANFEDGSPNGFGYTQYGDIEYIGTFKRFDILGEGTFYHVDDTENVFDQKVDAIIDEIIEDGMTDRQKLLAVHDYVVDTVKYHKPYVNVVDHPGETHTAYGALMEGSAVCDGYAQAFKVLIDRLGFENHLIFGITVDGNGVFQDYNRHAWNIVKYNGEYTHFDTTWDDPTYSDKVRHKYYFIDSDEISKDHQWDKDYYDQYLAPASSKE